MPHFLIIHKVAMYPESQDEWLDQWRDIKKKAHGDIEWIHSFLDPAAGKLYCQWKAESLESLMKFLTPSILEQGPVEYSSEIVLFDTIWLD